jgi:hypothetical protein
VASKELSHSQNDSCNKGSLHTPQSGNDGNSEGNEKVLGARMGVEGEGHSDQDAGNRGRHIRDPHGVGINRSGIHPHQPCRDFIIGGSPYRSAQVGLLKKNIKERDDPQSDYEIQKVVHRYLQIGR